MIQIKNKYTNEIIMEVETLRGADLWDANLRYTDLSDTNLSGANLRDADLRDANLRDANLRDADLRDANLHGADLEGADLEGADLRDANLRYTNLSDANLRNTNLRNVVGNMIEIYTIQTSHWPVVMTKDNISVGCENHNIKDWKSFTDEQLVKMDVRAIEFHMQWKDILLNMHELIFGDEINE